jgi:hypothetical protein
MIGRLIVFFASTNLLTALGQLAILILVRDLCNHRLIDLSLTRHQYLAFPKNAYVLPLIYMGNRCTSSRSVHTHPVLISKPSVRQLAARRAQHASVHSPRSPRCFRVYTAVRHT